MQSLYAQRLMAHRERARERRLLESIEREAQAPATAELDGAIVDIPRLLGVLSGEERAAMTLCYAHGFSHQEIAELTDWPLGTVKSHISRGKTKIREHFGIEVPT